MVLNRQPGCGVVRRRFRYWWLALPLGLGTVIGLGLFRYGPHLQWRISPAWITTRGIQPVPVSALPDSPPPDDFAHCQLGPLAFDVPTRMTSKPEFKGGRMSGVVLRDGSREVFVGLPQDNRQVAQTIRLGLADAGGLSSIPRVKAEAYAASSSDFRWSMSRPELARHRWLLGYAFLGRLSGTKAVETFSGGQVAGLLVIRDWGAVFEWYADGDNVSGELLFDQRHGEINLTWVRPICASLRYTHGVFGEEITADEVAKLFRIE
jgi:hypothetical protein